MKKKIILLLIMILVSCNQSKIEISDKNHLEKLNLKGKVKKLNISITQNELNNNNYIPQKKGINVLVNDLIKDINILFGKKIISLSNGNLYELLDSQSISFGKITSSVSPWNTDFNIEFNPQGYLKSIKAFDNKKLGYKKEWVYDNQNRLTKFIMTYNFNDDDDDGELTVAKTTYKYNKDNLLIKRTSEVNNIITEEIFKYKFEKNNIKVRENDDEIIIKLNKNKEIKQIKNNSNVINFKNYLITRKTGFNDNGEISNDSEYNYKDNQLILSKESIRYTSNSYYENLKYSYNEKGNINSKKSPAEKITSDIKFECKVASDIKFRYEYDLNSNWTNLKIELDKKYYNSAKIKLEEIRRKRNRISKNLHGREALRYILNGEGIIDAERNLYIIKKYSAQIEVKREISYY